MHSKFGAWVCFVLFLYVHGEIPPEYESKLDWALHRREAVSKGHVVHEKPETFLAYSFETVPFSYHKVRETIESYHAYEEIFSWLTRCIAVDSTKETYFFEMGKFIFRYWSVIDMEQRRVQDNVLYITFTQNTDDSLNTAWREQKDGIISIENNDFVLQWLIAAVDSETTRFGLVTYSVPNTRIPRWLTRMAMEIVVPACTQDIIAALEERNG
ncbi:MAG: hypothetical protein ACQEQ4_07935 [Fibrobacterota bacterium]